MTEKVSENGSAPNDRQPDKDESDIEEVVAEEVVKPVEKPKRKKREKSTKTRAPPPVQNEEENSADLIESQKPRGLVREDTVLFPGIYNIKFTTKHDCSVV